MNWYDPPEPDYTEEELHIMDTYLDKVRDEVIESLSPMQIAALFQDYDKFYHLYEKERADQLAEVLMD